MRDYDGIYRHSHGVGRTESTLLAREGITPKKVSRLILQSVDTLREIGISAVVRRSNGKRLIELRRAESDDAQGV